MHGTHPPAPSGRVPLAPIDEDRHAAAEILSDRLRRLRQLVDAFSACDGPGDVRRAVPGLLGVIPATMVRLVERSPPGTVVTAAWPETARDLSPCAHAAAPSHDALARGAPVWLESPRKIGASAELAAAAAALGVAAWGAFPLGAGRAALELGLPAAPRLDATEAGYLAVAASIVGGALLRSSLAERSEVMAELERAARSASAEMTAAFEALAAGLVVVTPDAGIVHMNRAALDLLAIDDVDRQGIRTLNDVLDHLVVEWPDGSRVRIPETPFSRARKGEIVRDVLVRAVPPGQPRRWIQASAVPLGPPGEVHHVVVSLVDVTRTQELEQEQRDLLREMFEELASPLRAVRERAGLIGGGARAPRDASSPAREIFRLVQRMEATMRELEDAVRVDSRALVASPELVDVKASLLDLMERIADDVDARRVVLCAPPGLPKVIVDPDHLERMLGELIRWALAGAVTGTDVLVACGAEEGAVRITIASKGLDVAGEDLPRIFDRFFRAPGRPAGRLYSARLLAEANGGRVLVEGVEGRGVAIHVELPTRAA